mmetsp:Transcript_21432/g.72624  ORF Transcript_21432/g.72624 Transcript_21432/m.72624 type:complete len:174 (-) Transcript_21432:978-1499(-)
METLRSRAGAKEGTCVLFVDFTTAFPTTLRTLALTRFRELGLRGGIIGTLWRLSCQSTGERLSVAPGLFTDSVDRQIGFGEGRVLSSLLFVFVIDELLVELRASGHGVQVAPSDGGPAVWAGAAMLTDDLALLARDETDLHAMFSIVLHWSWRRRFIISYPKTHLVRVRAHLH